MPELRQKFIFSAIAAAEVTLVDFSKLSGITRATLHNWKREDGGTTADALHLRVAYGLASRLDRATKAGLLPIKKQGQSKAELFQMLHKAISSVS